MQQLGAYWPGEVPDDFEAMELLQQWHGGQGSGTYSVLSMTTAGYDVPLESYAAAHRELRQHLRMQSQLKSSSARALEKRDELEALLAWLDSKGAQGNFGALVDSPDWIVERITATAEAKRYGRQAHYRLHVQGRNLSAGGERFSWAVHSVADPRFNLTNAIIDEAAVPFLGRG